MAKQPKLVLRESCAGDMSCGWQAGTFVEMGAGTGGMTRLFLDRGFHGACHDLGSDSRAMMRTNLAAYGEAIQVVEQIEELPGEAFDYLLAFEVLEHIENDAEVLSTWSRYLKPGGRLLVSVPAHQRKYGKSDELVGHVRRYEKAQLLKLIESAGFTDVRIVNYGFPITELTRRFSNYLVRNERGYEGMDAEQRSIRSAQAKPKTIARWLKVFSGRLVAPFCIVQRWFYGADLGDGYVATAVKRSQHGQASRASAGSISAISPDQS
ncbi:class I SAM-dependent methyltransferase [Hydrogenophaga sp. NFH-34]|uniref:class I SAM-dependent methyltransferase n=1 Tax=Hydrogenophaga sp. NFH-34 TaxID=2744446 RepID=UPI001F2AC0ED|nr:class I SAM-dependent methyltransferase [Hydrogenophaga sp. NFH-34]